MTKKKRTPAEKKDVKALLGWHETQAKQRISKPADSFVAKNFNVHLDKAIHKKKAIETKRKEQKEAADKELSEARSRPLTEGVNIFTTKKYEREKEATKEEIFGAEAAEEKKPQPITMGAISGDAFKHNEYMLVSNVEEEPQEQPETPPPETAATIPEAVRALEEKSNRKSLISRSMSEGQKQTKAIGGGLSLPVRALESEIVAAIRENLFTFIIAPTGSGKSTQVPLMLLEHGVGESVLGVTQPRRLAAAALATRVAEEAGLRLGREVGYQVRFERILGPQEALRLKFMTDGILLNEMMSDPLLEKYSVVMVDEVHERKIASDVLLGLLSRVARLRLRLAESAAARGERREPLRVVLMSATPNLADFIGNSRLFGEGVAKINVEAAKHKVNVFHARRTAEDFVEAAVEKAVKVHRMFGVGDLLVFMPGREEVMKVCRDITDELRRREDQFDRGDGNEEGEDEEEEEDKIRRGRNVKTFEGGNKMEIEGEENKEEDSEFEGEAEAEEPERVRRGAAYTGGTLTSNFEFRGQRFVVIPLFSKMDISRQSLVFAKTPGFRKIIVSTNVAETSLTIDGLRYLIDAGRENRRRAGAAGLVTHETCWISQASAEQRRGRVGRTGIGYCYRLYSQALLAKLEPHRPPDTRVLPLHHTLLQLARIGVRDLAGFPFPAPPPQEQLIETLEHLRRLGALRRTDAAWSPTKLGAALAALPVTPRIGKILLEAAALGMALPGVAVVAALEAEELVEARAKPRRNDEAEKDPNRIEVVSSRVSDLVTEANLLGDFLAQTGEFLPSADGSLVFRPKTALEVAARGWAPPRGVRAKALVEATRLMGQLAQLLSSAAADPETMRADFEKLTGRFPLPPPEEAALGRLVARASPTQIIRRRELLQDGRTKLVFETLTGQVVRLCRDSGVPASSPYIAYQILLAGDPPTAQRLTALSPQNLLDLARAQAIDIDEKVEISLPFAPKLVIIGGKFLVDCEFLFGQPRWNIQGARAELIDFLSGRFETQVYLLLSLALTNPVLFPRLSALEGKWSKNYSSLGASALLASVEMVELAGFLATQKVGDMKTLRKLNSESQEFRKMFLALVKPSERKNLERNFPLLF